MSSVHDSGTTFVWMINEGVKKDELVESRISDGSVKSSRSRLANPEEGGVLVVRRSDEG